MKLKLLSNGAEGHVSKTGSELKALDELVNKPTVAFQLLEKGNPANKTEGELKYIKS